MNILALETSTERLSIALRIRDAVFARDVDAGQRHSELTIPLLHEVLAEAGVALREVNCIAFGQGPGSFTGVRIACGLAQGLALGLGVPVMPIETQMAMAEQSGAERVLVAVDARMGELYFAAYEKSSNAADVFGWRAVVTPCLVRPEALPPISSTGAAWQGIGSAFYVEALANALRAQYGEVFSSIATETLPRAADVARLAQRAFTHGGVAISPSEAAPLYLRNNVAMTIAERAALRATKAAA